MNFRFFLIILLAILCSETALAQHRFQRRNIAWYTPSQADEINGLAIGASPTFDILKKEEEKRTTTINGLNVDANPLGIIMWGYAFGGSFMSPFYKGEQADVLANKNVFQDEAEANIFIRGANVSLLGTYGETNMSGIAITPVAFYGKEVKGISASLLMNGLYSFKGILLAGLQNKVTKGSGLQIGLFNYCEDCYGLQIGLLNKMGKRMLPIVNFRL